jgi:GYF domain 2
MPHWYVYDEGSEKGPFDHDDVIAYLHTRDPAHVYVWRQGLQEWVYPQDVPELALSIRPKPPQCQTTSIAPEIIVEPRQLDKCKLAFYSAATQGEYAARRRFPFRPDRPYIFGTRNLSRPLCRSCSPWELPSYHPATIASNTYRKPKHLRSLRIRSHLNWTKRTRERRVQAVHVSRLAQAAGRPVLA